MLSLDRQNELRERYRGLRPGWRPATEVFANLVRKRLTAGSHVLDIGCGRGGLVEQLDHPLNQMVGVDPDWQSLSEHRLELPRVVALTESLPLAADQFDLVYASWVLEHVGDPLADLANIKRVLKPGGSFVFITPNSRHPLIGLNRIIGRLGRVQTALVSRLYDRAADDTFPTYYRANNERQLRQLAHSTGLTLEQFQAIADPTYLAFTPALFKAAVWAEVNLLPNRPVHLVGAFRKA